MKAKVARSVKRADKAPMMVRETAPATAFFLELFRMDPMQRIGIVKRGVPSGMVLQLAEKLGVSRERLYGTVGVARATIDRKVKSRSRLGREEGESVLSLARLIGQVEEIMAESGDPDQARDFDAARWVARFLELPHPALGGNSPGSLMDTAEGRQVVSSLVARMQSGAYA